MIKFHRFLSSSQLYGSGLALILILLLLTVFLESNLFLFTAIGVSIILMISPLPFRFFAYTWFAFGELMSLIVGKLILSVIYLFLVVPIGLIKRKSIRANMHLSLFKKGTDSVFKERDHTFCEDDFNKLF